MGHFQHHGRQTAFAGQGLDGVAFPLLVGRGVVLFAQQQDGGQGLGTIEAFQMLQPARSIQGVRSQEAGGAESVRHSRPVPAPPAPKMARANL